MEVLDGTTIFWLIAIGMVAGAITKLLIWKKGVELVPNLIAGIIGAVVVGVISIVLDLPAGLAFSFIGSIAILFVLNVFHLEHGATH